MSEPTKDDLIAEAEKLGVTVTSDMTKADLKSEIAQAEGPTVPEQSQADLDAQEEVGIATPSQNAELEHTEGGATTRDDLTDQGVPMLQGSPDEPEGPEDAGGQGEKRGDYLHRVDPKTHEAVRIDGGSGARGELIENEDGGLDYAPHTRLENQAARTLDVGDAEGLKGGVETADNQ